MSLARLGVRNSFRRPVRTWLSVLGIALCIVLMLTVAAVSQRYVLVVNQSYSIYSTDIVVVSRASFLVQGIPLGGAVPDSTTSLIRQMSGVDYATPLLLVVNVQQLVPTNITIGVPIGNFTMFSKTTSLRLDGRYPTSANEVVLGRYLATTKNLSLGSSFNVAGDRLNVTGIVNTSNLVLSNAVIMPLQTAQSTQGYAGLVSAILVSSGAGKTSQVENEINSRLPGVIAISPSISEKFSNPLTSTIGLIGQSIDAFSLILALLFVAIISGVNILDQKEELLTIRAIGASTLATLRITLTQATITAAVGVALGVGMSALSTAVALKTYAGVSIIDSLFDSFSLIPLPTMALAVILVVGSALVVGTLATVSVVSESE